MTTGGILLAVLVSAVCTFALRALPFLAFNGERNMPLWLDRLGQVLPAAIMAVLMSEGRGQRFKRNCISERNCGSGCCS